MYQRLAMLVRQAPLTWFYSLSVAIVILTIPLFIVTGAQEAIDQAYIITGAPFNTDLLTWGRLVAAYPDAALGAMLALLQVGAPDIAVLIVVPLAFGWRGLIELKRRFRFWPRDMPWRRGFRVWGVATITFVLLSLATAALSQWVLPIESFTVAPQLTPATACRRVINGHVSRWWRAIRGKRLAGLCVAALASTPRAACCITDPGLVVVVVACSRQVRSCLELRSYTCPDHVRGADAQVHNADDYYDLFLGNVQAKQRLSRLRCTAFRTIRCGLAGKYKPRHLQLR